MNQCPMIFATSTVANRIGTSMMKFAIVIEVAFTGLESHAQLFLFPLDDHLC